MPDTSVELSTTWLGIPLSCPVILGASPLTDDIDALLACQQAGAGAMIMRSLFEEQIIAEQVATHRFVDSHTDGDAEARTFLPEASVFNAGSIPYINRLKKLVSQMKIPVFASLNGTTPGGWTQHAKELEDAGAKGIELNLYEIATNANESGQQVEERQLQALRGVVDAVKIPVNVKLSPFYSCLPAFVKSVEQTGAKGIAVFNRFYQPDVDLESLELSRDLRLSSNDELPMRLHALGVLYGHTTLDLAATGGVHHGDDAAKAILCGAKVVQVVSAVLHGGPAAISTILTQLNARLSAIGYRSGAEALGVMSLQNAPNPHAWERLNYARLLQSWANPKR